MAKRGLYLFFFVFFLNWGFWQPCAHAFMIVDKDFFWASPNLTQVQLVQSKQDSKSQRSKKARPIEELSYNSYFDQKGAHPPYLFLKPLKEGDLLVAKIKDGHLLLRKAGRRIPLGLPSFPQGASPVPSYLLSTPNGKWILVVYPYYLHQEKENRYLTEVYTDRGARVATYDNLPTHVSASNPDLLVSPERTGCCGSLKWSIRCYLPEPASVTELNCPEGFCGDVLFTKLGDNGTFLMVQEIVGRVGEIGASMQTNFYMVENDGRLSTSGKAPYAIRDPKLNQQKWEFLSPFAISNLISIDPLFEKDGWGILFDIGAQRSTFELKSTYKDPAPSIVFLLPKDPSVNAKKGVVKVKGNHLGTLPILGVTHPGQVRFEVSFESDRQEIVEKEIKFDVVNIIMF